MYQQFILLFALIVTGYIAKKRQIINDSMNHGMNKFIITVAYPCLILDRMGSLEVPQGVFANFVLATVLALVMFLMYGTYAYLIIRKSRCSEVDAPVAEFAILAPNNGFMGFPIAVTFFGELGLLYMVAGNLALNIIFFSYGISLMRRGEDTEHIPGIKKVLKILSLLANPKISAALLGLILCSMDVVLPEMIQKYLSLVGGIATPMAMIFIGASLSDCELKTVIRNRTALNVAVNKLVIVPAITFLLLYFLPVDPYVKIALILGSAMPVATTVPIFAEQYSRNAGFASQLLFLSTILSMASIPLTVTILKQVIIV